MTAAAAERPPIAPPLIAWAREHGRHDLPWQHPSSPYRVWVSEIMLQQTQVATVIPYFKRFVRRFPSLGTLAEAELPEVLALWSGLGYYARARNLHAAARRCRESNGGELPRSLDELMALPGIGRSTAGAILALAHDRCAPILDGNAKRVLARYHGIRDWPGKSSVARELWRQAERETPAKSAAAYTQAIMDLGATLCTRNAPDCGRCPIAADCAAHLTGCEADFPAPRPKRPRPLRKRRYALIERAGEILFEQRPPTGVWGGLLCLPEFADDVTPEDWCENTLGLRLRAWHELPGFDHEFTHFRLTARVVGLVAEGTAIREDERYRWLSHDDAMEMGLPAPIRAYIRAQRHPSLVGTGHARDKMFERRDREQARSCKPAKIES